MVKGYNGTDSSSFSNYKIVDEFTDDNDKGIFLNKLLVFDKPSPL